MKFWHWQTPAWGTTASNSRRGSNQGRISVNRNSIFTCVAAVLKQVVGRWTVSTTCWRLPVITWPTGLLRDRLSVFNHGEILGEAVARAGSISGVILQQRLQPG